MDEIEIPQYFICPISLQIMKDPVTTVAGITYDRESIEQWLLTATAEDRYSAVCPVTKQPLPTDSDLTPNHILRRLIQAWCIANAKSGIDQIPTPKSPVHKSVVFKLIRDVKSGDRLLHVNALKKLDELAAEDEKNRKCMAEAGVPKAMVSLILKRFREGKMSGIEEALRILHLTWIPSTAENQKIVEDYMDLIQLILWVLNSESENGTSSKNHALSFLKNIIEVASSSVRERLNLEFFKQMVNILRKRTSPQAMKSVLRVLIETSPSGRNRMKIVEAGAVFEITQLELSNPDKKTTELILNLLANLCSCADGRQKLLEHAGGIAMVAKRLLRVSPATDDSALCIIESLARFSATREVVFEMLRVSAVSKLCMVLQADCAGYLKIKAREILRLHSNAWSNSPCIQVYLLTMHPR
ncbi:E3 ubiquitin-protein ligase PUB24-like [Primulina huaijiensis]|uniref:E3 ubiquitin-protein ligase PUB24-like n=1 Tax=Primulina huaijiensis TaxID=1492673 RepID=UPI003CC70B65